MKTPLLALAAISLLSGAMAAVAGPEEDRIKMVNYMKAKFPDVKLEDHVYGALALDPDSKSQYDFIMEFPPYTSQLEAGEKQFKKPFKNGKTYADCLPNGGRMIAGNYPLYDEAKGKVITLEEVVNSCRVANGEPAADVSDDQDFDLLMAHVRRLSNGMKMNIKVQSPAAQQAYADGKKTYYQRIGQLNFSCASCHVSGAGNRLRSELLSPLTGQAVHWPVFLGGETVTSLQKRYERCFNLVRHVPEKPGSTRMNNLEYFHSYMSNGLEMKASVFRK
jgi:sulfur-oxidizing protein SoxA